MEFPVRALQYGKRGSVETRKVESARDRSVGSTGSQMVLAQRSPGPRVFNPNEGKITIPGRHSFYWVKAQGLWIWHPQLGPTGPAGPGPADGHFVIPWVNAGVLVAQNWDWSLDFSYRPEMDLSNSTDGTVTAYVNDSDQALDIWFGCNDHDGGYDDNSGSLAHEVAWLPS